jgi:hypothetical protein
MFSDSIWTSAGHNADHSPLPGAKVKKVWSYTSTLPSVFSAWCLIGTNDKLYQLCMQSVVVAVVVVVCWYVSLYILRHYGHYSLFIILM